jgi:predicted metal-dependent hydrolase
MASSSESSSTSAEKFSYGVPIVPRYPRMQFPPIAPITKETGWYDNDPAITEFLHALSTVFPLGEKFFIDSVVHYRDRIDHPKLQEQVKGFVSQEMQHSAQHVKYNNRIEQEYGHKIANIEKLVAFVLSVPRKVGVPLGLLAITCALEHFTAIMANVLLATEKGKEALSKMPLHHRTIWIWHALEETEHKAVAFDVYVAMGGGYLRRLLIFFIVSFHFCLWLSVIFCYLLWNRGILFRLSTWKSVVNFFWFEPGLVRLLFPSWCDYLKKDFHPWQHQNAYLISQYTKTLDLVETGKSH